jgi:hypothetical protein
MNERARWSLFWLWLAVGVGCPWGAFDAAASEIYTYTDDQGNFVASDSLENVPERYRGRAKAREVQDSGAPVRPAAPPSGFESFLLGLAERLPKVLTIPGTNAFQTIVLVAGGLAAVLMLAGMHLSANPAVRLLMKCMLGFLVVGATYLMYFSDLGERAATASGQPASSGTFMQKAKDSAKTQEAIHQQRAKEIEALDQPGQAPR